MNRAQASSRSALTRFRSARLRQRHNPYSWTGSLQDLPLESTVTLTVRGVRFARRRDSVERTLGLLPGVTAVDARPARQLVYVTFNPERTTVSDLLEWIAECRRHCAGQPVHRHVCEPPPAPAVSQLGRRAPDTTRSPPCHNHR